MKNKWEDVSEMIDYSKGGIISKVIEKNDISDVTLFCMSKETEISTHTSTKAGYVYVVEGNGIFNLEGEEIHIKPGILIFMSANAKHSLSAKEDTSFILILNKI
ncbi:cupin domain-containing protein [archaeon]|jgi:quercetin dioxygenase-like cupin family protein|nr:cupin domain-containing protein [archaeon]MBT3465048.1 cupin domain-containing protein [archaeon]MBT6869279.1 cupin domain-containing protein [archaeon]MBT7193677.1 cupin domain-containing protein [archaeon]MBT7381211.1 cupin domain-containing protein [archaeon]